jgi:FXSXX-COOH protein
MDVMDTQVETTSGLLDLRHLSLTQLLSAQRDAVLDYSIRKVTAAAEERPQKSVSAFNSAV